MPREAPLDFFKQKNKLQYQLINLAVVEASYVYMSYLDSTSTKTAVKVSETVRVILNAATTAHGYDYFSSGDGFCWCLSFDDGANVGAMRKVSTYNATTGTFTFDVPLDNDPSTVPDKIRISKNLFLVSKVDPVNFYIPDQSYGADVAMTYVPFPMTIVPMGTNAKGEVMTLDITLSAVNKVIVNAVLLANGIQGNRVYHLRVFEGTLDQGKEYCIKDSAYIDSVSINNTQIQFLLESKHNIVDVQLPGCSYNIDFCRFRFKGTECSWSLTGTGAGDGVLFDYYEKKNAAGIVIKDYPLVSPDTCDHTLNGSNGCQAHNNALRFGGFPTL